MALYGNMIGGAAPLKTLKLVDESGAEIVGVVTESVQIFDATPSDVRINKTFVSDDGIGVGENTITYRTISSSRIIMPGENYYIPLRANDQYDYTKLQCLVAEFNTSTSDSVNVVSVVMNDNLYAANSTTVIASVSKNVENKSIDFNMTNNTDKVYIIHYFTYKQEVS